MKKQRKCPVCRSSKVKGDNTKLHCLKCGYIWVSDSERKKVPYNSWILLRVIDYYRISDYYIIKDLLTYSFPFPIRNKYNTYTLSTWWIEYLNFSYMSYSSSQGNMVYNCL